MFYCVMQDDDERLIIERLYELYKDYMYRAANYILKDQYAAEDAVHQSFERIMNNLHKIDESSPAKTRAFLVRICKNVALDFYNEKLPLSTVEEYTEAETFASASPLPDDIVISKETVKIVTRIIEKLDPIYKDVFLFKRVNKMSVEEISDMTGVSVEAVKKRLQRAKQMILEGLNREVSYNE